LFFKGLAMGGAFFGGAFGGMFCSFGGKNCRAFPAAHL